MINFKENNIIVNVCTDIEEWARLFYDMPQDATIDNLEEVTSECMGFADIENNTIWIYIPTNYELKDLKETIAHEVGHLHYTYLSADEEVKANYYMEYFMLTDNIINKIINL